MKKHKQKQKQICNFFEKLKDDKKSVIISYSGGVDSALLAYFAKQTEGLKAVAVTFKTEFMKKEELKLAKKTAKEIGIEHIIISFEIFDQEKIKKEEVNFKIIQNDENRCYFCKKNMYQFLINYALENGFDLILDGTNLDDLKEYRPGKKVLDEMSDFVISPLKDFEFSKKEIRKIAKENGLSVYDKPSESCIATRFEYGEKLNKEMLKVVEKIEYVLKKEGFSNVRARVHLIGSNKKLLRIEIDQKDFKSLSDYRKLSKTNKAIQKIKKDSEDFSYVTIDMNGYVTGSMDL